MVRMMVRFSISLLLAGILVPGFGAPPVIGIATVHGSLRVDNVPVQGNATLFDGARLETASASSRIRLQAGGQMELGTASRGQVFSDRLILEKGLGRMEYVPHYRFEARNLRIEPDSIGSSAEVLLSEPGRVTVNALSGQVRVSTAEGLLLARLEPGGSLEFQPQAAGAVAPFVLTGCLAGADGRILLTDETAKVSFELKGKELTQYIGQRVEIQAAAPGNGPAGSGPKVVQVVQIKRVAGGCPAMPPSRNGSQAKAPRMSGSTKAVIAGVAIAAGAGGAALGLTGGETTTPISR